MSALTIVIFAATSFSASNAVPIGPDEVFIQNTEPNELKIMSYNVLNLFDADKDPGKEDWLWLPKNYPGRQEACKKITDQRDKNMCSQFDWTYSKVDLKLNQIKKVVSFQGSLPDMMAVVEVENANVLGLLAKKLGYKNFIITDGPDLRGIDVGLMYNTTSELNFIKWEPIHVQLKSGRFTRDILRADFKWKNSLLSIYVNHWPSQRNPTEERLTVAKTLGDDIDKMTRLMGDQWSAVAIGDFNTIDNDQPNPINDVIQNPDWSNALVDAETYARESLRNPALPYMPSGSYYYIKDDVWNEFDRIEVTKNLTNQKGIEFIQDSFRIIFPEFMGITRKRFENESEQKFKSQNSDEPTKNFKYVRVPNAYNFETNNEAQRGFSDHLPVVFKLRQ